MKKVIYILFFIFSVITINAKNALVQNISSINGFIENKGQFVDMNGDLIPDVLYRIEAPNVDLYITSKGMTYVFKKKRKVEISKNELNNYEKNLQKKGGKFYTRYIDWERIDVTFDQGTISKENIIRENKSNQGSLNYYLAHAPNGILGVNEFGKITIKNLYPNIDWVLYNTSDNGFKYDFVLHKGAQFSDIKMLYNSKEKAALNSNGDITIKTKYGELLEETPISYYGGKLVNSSFHLISSIPDQLNGYSSRFEFSFSDEVEKTIGKKELIIDPVLQWSTFYGGNNADGPWSIETDNENNAIVVGYTTSTDFPVQNNGGYYQSNLVTGSPVWSDCFIVKLDSNGNRKWATYYGGDHHEILFDLATDADNNIFVVGETISSDFPLQDNGGFFQTTSAGSRTGIGIKFDQNGNRLWASYIGGTDADICHAIDYNAFLNNFTVVGLTLSADFPTEYKSGAYNQSSAIASTEMGFVAVFDANCDLDWSTYLKGSNSTRATDVSSDSFGNIIVVGNNSSTDFPLVDMGGYFQGILPFYTYGNYYVNSFFITKFNTNNSIIWSTFYGGEYYESNPIVKVDGADNIIVLGVSNSTDFPVQNNGGHFENYQPYSNSVILKFDNMGNRLFSSFFNSGYQQNNIINVFGNMLAVDKCNNHFYIYVGAKNLNIPIVAATSNSYTQNGLGSNNANGEELDNFLAEFDENFDLVNTTYFGGEDDELRGCITVDQSGYVWVSGEWIVDNAIASYPLVEGDGYFDNTYGGGDDGYLAKFKSDFPSGVIELPLESINFCDSININNSWYLSSQTVTNIIKNQYGCDSIIETFDLTLNCDETIAENILYIPNIFTPNGDLDNDFFSIKINNKIVSKNGILTIYNRWGVEVFSSNELIQWDGGENSTGVYFYLFEYENNVYKGTVSLFK